MPETSAWKGIFWGLVYGGLAFAVGFSTIVAIGGDASSEEFQVQEQCLVVCYTLSYLR